MIKMHYNEYIISRGGNGMNKERASNFELLRILSMFFIVLCHTIHHGNMIINCTNEGLKVILQIMILIIVVHVNSFVLITGYFQSKSEFKQSKLWSIINANWFYRVLILIIFSLLNLEVFTTVDKFINIFPLNLEEYWFINPYLVLYCLSPFLNKFIDSLQKKDYQKLLIVLFILLSIFPYITGNRIYPNSGYTLYNFIVLYLIGAYLRRYPLKESHLFKKLSNNGFQLFTIVVFLICIIVNYSFGVTANSLLRKNSLFDMLGYSIIDMTIAYSNPLVIIQSIAFFSFFGTLNFRSKIVNKLSKLTLGIYMIHENPYVRKNIYKWIGIDGREIASYKYVLYALLAAAMIYIGCSIIEYIRQLIFKGISRFKISKKIREKYYSYIKDIYIKQEPEKT